MPILPLLLLPVSCRTPATHGEPWAGWRVTETDSDTFSRWDGVLQTWEVGPAYHNWFPTLFGDNRRFHIAYRGTLSHDETRPVLLMLHGSGIDDDSDPAYYAGDPEETICGAGRAIAAAYLDPTSLVPVLALQRDWVIITPEGLWCDGWKGLGPDDPVDANHAGFAHLDEVLSFVEAGGLGFTPGPLYGWGSSSGGGGVVLAEAWHGGFDGLVVDSAPCDWLAYWQADPEPVSHLFGGAPYQDDGVTETSRYAAYNEDSCDTILRESVRDTPVFATFNTHDRLVPPSHGQELSKALSDSPRRSFAHDFDRYAAGDSNHTQTRTRTIPMGYIPALAMAFLADEREVLWIEAESCEGCDPALVVEDQPEGSDWDDFSGRGGLELTQATTVAIAVPDALTGTSVTATVLLQLDSDTTPSDLILRVGDTTTTVPADRLIVGEQDELDRIIEHIEATSISFEARNGDTLEIVSSDTTHIRVDAVAFTSHDRL